MSLAMSGKSNEKAKFVFDINYKRMYENIRECNKKLLHKLEVHKRSVAYWKKQQAKIIDALWGWTAESEDKAGRVIVDHPIRTLIKKRKAASAKGFTFPPTAHEVAIGPETPTTVNVEIPTSPTKNNTEKGQSKEKEKQTPTKPRRNEAVEKEKKYKKRRSMRAQSKNFRPRRV